MARDVTAEDIGKGLDPDVVGRVERRHAKMLADFDRGARSDALTQAGAPGT